MKTCLACDKPLKGRTDKKYCNDYCRNQFNSRLSADSCNLARNIVNALRRNKRILAGFLGNDRKAKTTRHHLLREGFQFKYHTHIAETRGGGQYIYCFDLGYRPLDRDAILLVREETP